MPLARNQNIPLASAHDVMITMNAVVVLLHVLKLYLINPLSPQVPSIKNGQKYQGKDRYKSAGTDQIEPIHGRQKYRGFVTK